MRALVVCVLLLLTTANAQRLGGTIMASPVMSAQDDAIPLQPVPPLRPPLMNDDVSMLPYLDVVVQYVQAWHTLAVGAERASTDLTNVVETVTSAFEIATRHRHDIIQATPWFLRLFLNRL